MTITINDINKDMPLNQNIINYISESPFLLLASASSQYGADISPRGDDRGFVKTLDGNTLLIPDRIGNNRLDSLTNIIANPYIILLFLTPQDDTILIADGKAEISFDPDLLSQFVIKNKQPRTVIKVRVNQAKLEKSKSLNSANFWSADLSDIPEIPTLGDILSDQIGNLSKQDANKFVGESYAKRLY